MAGTRSLKGRFGGARHVVGYLRRSNLAGNWNLLLECSISVRRLIMHPGSHAKRAHDGGEHTGTPSANAGFCFLDLKNCEIRCLLLVFLSSCPSLTSSALLCNLRNMMSCRLAASATHTAGYIRRTRRTSLADNKFPGIWATS
jgi:hypothetical protein